MKLLKKTNLPITLNTWMTYQPYVVPSSIDVAYYNFAIKIFEKIEQFTKNGVELSTLKLIALQTTAYLQDKISDLGLWNAFVRKNQELYGQPLPFIFIENSKKYQLDDINKADLKYIVWSIIQKTEATKKKAFVKPINPMIEFIVEELYVTFYQAFEELPINETLKNYYNNRKISDNFFSFRDFLEDFWGTSYLLQLEVEQQKRNTNEYIKTNKSGKQIQYSIAKNLMLMCPCGPLSLFPFEWFGEMLIDQPKIHQICKEMKVREQQAYICKNQNNNEIVLEDPITEELFTVTTKSVTFKMSVKNQVITTSLVYYDKEWWVNGASGVSNFCDCEETLKREKEKEKNFKYTYNVFFNTHRSPIYYFATFSDYLNFVNSHTKGFQNQPSMKSMIDQTNVVLFLHPNFGSIVSPDFALILKGPKNPYYKASENINFAWLFIDNNNNAPEFLRYIIDNDLTHDMFPFFYSGKVKVTKKQIRGTFDFIARCLLQKSYTGNSNLLSLNS